MLEESPLLWLGFFVIVVILLALDLGVLNRGSHHIPVKKALYLTAFWIAISIIFGIFIFLEMGDQKGMEYFTGYIIEKAMSVDNLFVFILIFAIFEVPDEYQHKALFYGIIGALVFRAIFIFAGAELLERFEIVMYIFGILLIYAAIKTMVKKDDSNGENMFAVKLSKHIKCSEDFDCDKLFTMKNGKKLMTPLLLCILVIEFTDIIFALDSIPAILAITTDTFIVYTSNIFAILGLRSLFFALKGSLESLEYLKYGLGIILIFVGVKLLISKWYEFSIPFSLGFIGVVLIVTITVSLIMRKRTSSKNGI